MGSLIGMVFGVGLCLVMWNHDDQLVRLARQVRRKESHISFAWPAFIEDVASGVRAGLGLPQSTWQAGSRLPLASSSVFAEAEKIWKSGEGFDAALVFLTHQFPNSACEQFVHTIELAHRQGGHSISTLLSHFARDLRSQQQLIHEVKGRQAVTATSAKVALAAPWVVLAMTCTREDVRATYSTSVGAVVLMVIALVSFGSYLLMKKIARISELEVLR